MSNEKKRCHKRPQTKEQFWTMIGRLRIGELNKLFRRRYAGYDGEYELPDDDSGREDLMILLHHYANSNPLQMTKIIKLRAPWMGGEERRSVLDRVAAYPWRWRSETLGRRLHVTKVEWQSLNLRTIAPVEMTRNERSQERKLRNRLRMHHKRRREGRKSRAEYESNSLSRTKPWLAEGISRRTWERRRRADEKACRKCVSHKDVFKAVHTLATSEQAATSSRGRPSKDTATIGAEARSHRDRAKREGEYHARKQRPAPILSHPNFVAKATRNDVYLAPAAGDCLDHPRRTEADGQPAGQECSHLARFGVLNRQREGRMSGLSQPRRIPAHSELLRTDTIRSDTPLRLDVAAALAYPDGSMTASGLRREHKRGRLIIERTGKITIAQEDGGMSEQFTAADLAREYGYTPRHWMRLAASGIVPGATQPTGRNGKWFFDKAVFRRWWVSRQQEVPCVSNAGAKRIGSAPSVRIENTAEASRQRTERLLIDVLGRG